MNKIRLALNDFAKLDDSKRSGDLIDVVPGVRIVIGDGVQSVAINYIDVGVYHVLRYDILSDHFDCYAPTIAGYTLWLIDVVTEWLLLRKWRFIHWLDRHNFAHVPEGCYPLWSDIGKKPPSRYPAKVKPLTWGDIRSMLNVGSWGDWH